jgi:SAM-dependent methyltransferase
MLKRYLKPLFILKQLLSSHIDLAFLDYLSSFIENYTTSKTNLSKLDQLAVQLNELSDEQLAVSLDQSIEVGRRLHKDQEQARKIYSGLISKLQNFESLIANTYFQRISSLRPFGIKSRIKAIDSKAARKQVMRCLVSQKEQTIIDAVNKDLISWEQELDSDLHWGPGLDERVIEIPLALKFADLSHPGKVLDAGSALNNRYIKDLVSNIQSNLIHFTQTAEKEPVETFADKISYVFGDLRCTDFKDGVFDRIVCISTLEHIGMDNTRYGADLEKYPMAYLDVLKELMRILSPGGKLFLTFPYGESKDYGWYQMFNLKQVSEMIQLTKPSSYKAKYYYYSGYWFEGNPTDYLPPNDDDKEVSGICTLLLIK